MIAARRLQQSFADGLIFGEVEDLWEPWMRHADKALEDEALLLLIQQELMKRCRKSKTRGRPATPAEVVLRMMLLKHVRDWSYEVLVQVTISEAVTVYLSRIRSAFVCATGQGQPCVSRIYAYRRRESPGR